MIPSCIFLSDDGAKALEHLSTIFFRNKNVLDCAEVHFGGQYLEAKLVAQHEPFRSLKPCHVLIPHHFVTLVVLDQPQKLIGFGPIPLTNKAGDEHK